MIGDNFIIICSNGFVSQIDDFFCGHSELIILKNNQNLEVN
jgi:hypothetical protein